MNGTPRPQSVTSDNGSLVDDFLRRELRVGDPRNLGSVLVALQRRYPAAVQRLEQESTGVPVQLSTVMELPGVILPAVATPSSREGQRVTDNLDRDLQALLMHPANRDVLPELRGWRSTLTREVSEGLAAAALAQDPAKRDRAFTAVRLLEEAARAARLTSTNRVELLYEYRRLATTIDAAAMAIRIAMGEALDAAGLSDGGLILPIAATEGRERKQGLVYAIRRLTGGADEDDWPDAAASFSQLRSRLLKRRRTELLVYLREEELTVRLDRLLGEVERQDTSSLRELTADSIGELSRLQELLAVIAEPDGDPLPASEALSAFSQNLRLFLELFGFGDGARSSRIGARLTELALPLPLAATSGDDIDRIGRRKLRRLVTERQEFAIAIENRFEGAANGGDDDELERLEHADQSLYHLDRAIDLMAQGSEDQDGEEKAAVAHLKIASEMLGQVKGITLQLQDMPAATHGRLKRIVRQTVRDFLAWRTLTRALTSDYLSGSLSKKIPPFVMALLKTAFSSSNWWSDLADDPHISKLEALVRLPAIRVPATERGSLDELVTTVGRMTNPEEPPEYGGTGSVAAQAVESESEPQGGRGSQQESAGTPVALSPPPRTSLEGVPPKVQEQLGELLERTRTTIDQLDKREWPEAARRLRGLWQAIQADVARVAGPGHLAFEALFSDCAFEAVERIQVTKRAQLDVCRQIFNTIISNEATS